MNISRIATVATLAASLAVSAPAAPAPAHVVPTLEIAPQAGAEYVRPVGLMNWADRIIAKAGLTRPAGLRVVLSNEENCGADISPVGLGGCTHYTDEGPVVVVSPALAGWLGDRGAREHLVFHEFGHALGIADECEAEDFAHEYDGVPDYWAYPACEER